MKIFDKNTGEEIKFSENTNDDIFAQLLKKYNNKLRNLIIGIGVEEDCRGIFANVCFYNCTFNKIHFTCLKGANFTECTFLDSSIYRADTLTMWRCDGYLTISTLNGICGFNNCSGNIQIHDINTPYVSIIDCVNFDGISRKVESVKNKLSSDKKIKTGYKVIYMPVLVKLSFPEDTKFIEFGTHCRSDKAFVESVKYIKEFEGNGVTNYRYKKCNYKVGEIVYPDKFDVSLDSCSHGINFYENYKDALAELSDQIDLKKYMDM